MPLIWSAVTRGTTVLCECGEDHRGGEVLRLAQRILRKRPTPGWETDRAGSLRALKFHVYYTSAEQSTGGASSSSAPSSSRSSSREGRRAAVGPPTLYSFVCVHDADFPDMQARGFLEKLALMCEPLRYSANWLRGDTLAAQETFAPTLLQRMEQVS